MKTDPQSLIFGDILIVFEQTLFKSNINNSYSEHIYFTVSFVASF